MGLPGWCGALPLQPASFHSPQQGELGWAGNSDQSWQWPPQLPLGLVGKAAPEMGWDKVGAGVVPGSAGPRAGQGCGVFGPWLKCSFEEEDEPH